MVTIFNDWVPAVKIFSFLLVLFFSSSAIAAERLPINQIDVNAVTQEGQIIAGGNSQIDLAWWIPVEFWQASLAANPSVPEFQAKMVTDTLKPYSVLAIVQADISDFGAFTFYDEAAISDNMLIEYFDADGNKTAVSHTADVSPDVVIMLNQMVPVLAAAMGNMGQNFYFFPLPDEGENGERLMSPYEKGSIRVTLGARKDAEASVINVELPFDSLHIPRLCPNGKPAHISWNFCPWSGDEPK